MNGIDQLIARIMHDVHVLQEQPDLPKETPVVLSASELESILRAHLDTPATNQFLGAVAAELIHQVARWGTVHDRAKQPQDWFWLLGFLAGKALAAHSAGDSEKAMHHTISSAAVLANWWAHIRTGAGAFTPGASDLQKFLVETFGETWTRS